MTNASATVRPILRSTQPKPTTPVCTALVRGNGGKECTEHVPEGVEIALCAFHLLVAAQTVEEVGRTYLISLVPIPTHPEVA